MRTRSGKNLYNMHRRATLTRAQFAALPTSRCVARRAVRQFNFQLFPVCRALCVRSARTGCDTSLTRHYMGAKNAGKTAYKVTPTRCVDAAGRDAHSFITVKTTLNGEWVSCACMKRSAANFVYTPDLRGVRVSCGKIYDTQRSP